VHIFMLRVCKNASQYSKLVMAKDVVCTFASSQSVMSNREATKVLGVDKKTSRRHLKDDTC
jgi:hypothetical protein